MRKINGRVSSFTQPSDHSGGNFLYFFSFFLFSFFVLFKLIFTIVNNILVSFGPCHDADLNLLAKLLIKINTIFQHYSLHEFYVTLSEVFIWPAVKRWPSLKMLKCWQSFTIFGVPAHISRTQDSPHTLFAGLYHSTQNLYHILPNLILSKQIEKILHFTNLIPIY